MEWSPYPLHTHMQGVWDHLYAMDWPMGCLQHNCLDQICKFLKNRVAQLGYKYHLVEWLRLRTHTEWSPQQLHSTYPRCLRSFICYDLADGSINMLLPSLLDHICKLLKKLSAAAGVPMLSWWSDHQPSCLTIILFWPDLRCSWGTNVIMEELLRLQTNMDWSL